MTSDSLRAQNTQCFFFFANMEYRTRTIVDCNFIKIKFGIRQGAGPALGPADLANDVAIVKQLKTDFVHMSWTGQRKSSADPYSVLVLERQVKFFFRRPSSEVNFFNKNTTMHAPRSICVQPHCSTVLRLLQLPSHQPCAMASTATPGRQLDQHTRPETSSSLTLGHCHCAAATSRQERTIENLSSSTKARLALHLARLLSSAFRDSHSGSPTAPFLQKPAILTVPLFSFSPFSVRTARAEERPNVRDVLVQDEGPRLCFLSCKTVSSARCACYMPSRASFSRNQTHWLADERSSCRTEEATTSEAAETTRTTEVSKRVWPANNKWIRDGCRAVHGVAKVPHTPRGHHQHAFPCRVAAESFMQ